MCLKDQARTKHIQMVHVGILINNGSQFVNGSEQQPQFVIELLRGLGLPFTLYTHAGVKTASKHNGLLRTPDFYGTPMKLLTDSDLSHISTFLMICHITDDPKTEQIRQQLQHAKVVSFHCGNHAYFNAEDICFNKHDVVHLLYNTWFTESWVFPMHRFASTYYEMLTGKPTKTMPYVWSPSLIDKFAVDNQLDIHCNPELYKTGRKLTLCCMEPNLNITKTCIVPLLIMNRVYELRPELIEKCLVFCAQHLLQHKGFKDLLKFLKLHKDGLIEFYPRTPLPLALHQLKQRGMAPVIIGHQIANSQNYVSLEALHLGYPLVHNSPPLETAGFYYEEWSMDTAVTKILKFQTDFAEKHSVYTGRADAVLHQCSTANPSNLHAFRKLLK